MANIRELIKELVKDNEEMYSVICKVNEVNEGKRVCDVSPLDGSADIFDVRLQSKVNNDTGITMFPKKDSEVVVTFMSKELAFVSLTNDIEKIKLDIGEFSLFIDKDNWENTVKTTKINTDSYDLTGKTVNFEASKSFDIETKKTTVNSPVVDIKGNTTITGNTVISGNFSTGGGANGGIPKTASVVMELNKISLELNKVIVALKAWTPKPKDGGQALKDKVKNINMVAPANPITISNPKALH